MNFKTHLKSTSNKLNMLSLFSGIGAFEKALVNIGIDFQLVNYCEVDKYASKAYAAIHNVDDNLNLGDITKIEIDKLPKGIDIITHGSPCQDFSVAGKGRGGEQGSGTRSSLMWNTVEIIKHTLPKYVVWENVKNIISKKHVHNFNKYIDILKDLGYTSYYKVLNSKDYGVPQNRERVYCISILGDHKPFIFPDPIKLELRLKDILVNKVDQKYYIKDEISHPLLEKIVIKECNNNKLNMVGRVNIGSYDMSNRVYSSENIFPTVTSGEPRPKILCNMNPSENGMNGNIYNAEEISPTITTNKGEGPKVCYKVNEDDTIRIGGRWDTDTRTRQAGGIYDTEGISPTIAARCGGGVGPYIKTENNNIITVGNYIPSGHDASRIVSETGIAPTVKENHGTVTAVLYEENNESEVCYKVKQATKTGYDIAQEGDSIDLSYANQNTRRGRVGKQICNTLDTGANKNVVQNYKIRKLIPLECWRLQGFSDSDFEKAKAVPTSNTQLYKMAGNSITVNVLEAIFENLLNDNMDPEIDIVNDIWINEGYVEEEEGVLYDDMF